MIWLAAGIAGFGTALIGQSLLLRATALRNGMVAFLLAGLPIGLVLILMLARHAGRDETIAGVLLYAFLCELWMWIFSAAFSSVSANLLLHLRSKNLTYDDIDLAYDDRQMILRRIEWLEHIGAIQALDGQLVPTRRGRALASLFNAVRAFFGHP